MNNQSGYIQTRFGDPANRRRIYVGAFIALIIAGVYTGLNELFPEYDGHYGFWSIMPPLVAILLAFWTREVVSALFIGICLGGVIAGEVNVVEHFLIPSIGTESFALILLVYLWALGGLIGIWTRTGGAERFAVWASNLMVRGPRSAKFFTWMMGLIFHQGGTISTVLTGATVRPVSDKHNVSHEELSYMVDSTASPAATLIPFNVWPIYVSGLVIGTVAIFETPADGINFFFSSLPYNFYAIFAILITLLFALELLPWVPGKKMRKAIERSRTKGLLDRKGATPMAADELTQSKVPKNYNPGLIDFFGPIGGLLGVAIIPYAYTYFILGSESPTLLIAEAFVLSVLIGIGIALAKGMSLQVAINGFIDGCKGVTIGAIILALAVTLKEVADAVGTADYVVMMIGDLIWPAFLPGVLMVLCMIIAFSTGTSWGTYAVVFPIAMPLAWAVVPEVFFLQLCFAAVIGGSVMGDQCSPISDTTILSSLATGCDLMDHVTTQLPLAIAAGILAMISYALLVILFV
ncbi:MAG: sodium:proton antiporter [Balneolaceae bacterium]|nr:sodium:proton antiporter [Balneolaceae bacterium]